MPLSTASIVLIFAAAGHLSTLILPTIVSGTKWSDTVGRAYVGLATATLGRPGLTLNEFGELTPKSLSVDEESGALQRKVGGVTKKFTDTAGAIHQFGTVPLSIVDERFGTAIDPRAAWVAERLNTHQNAGTWMTTLRGEAGRVHYVRAFFEVPDRRSLVELSAARDIVDGAETSTTWDHVDGLVEKMFALDGSQTSTFRLLLPILCLIGAFAIATLALGQAGGGGGGGTTVAIGNATSGMGVSP